MGKNGDALPEAKKQQVHQNQTLKAYLFIQLSLAKQTDERQHAGPETHYHQHPATHESLRQKNIYAYSV
jgi:hypothetical protein